MSFKEYVKSYPLYHQHPVNKGIHLLFIPVIIAGLGMLVTSHWPWGILAIVGGFTVLWIGHRIEGNQPASQKNPIYVLAAPIWYGQMIWSGLRQCLKGKGA